MRKLAVTACFFSAAVCASQYLVGGTWRLICAGVFALSLAAAALMKEKKLCAALIGLCAGFIWCIGWDAVVLGRVRALAARSEIT
ncbi:MAG: hypothetical protein J5827_03085, partial [Oscillospiraceae bacterium]|nr:hypothetical protein [Oscillospiraceae bacterium]